MSKIKHIVFLIIIFTSQSNAVVTFQKTYGGTSSDKGYSIQQTSDDGYIITGWLYSTSMGRYEMCVLKTDSLGDTLWTKSFYGNKSAIGSSVQQTKDGGYIVTGTTYSYPTQEDVYIIKMDSLGAVLWAKVFGGNDMDWGISTQQTKDGQYIVLAGTHADTVNWTNYLIKMDSSGNILDTLWTETSENDGAVQETQDNGYIITGSTHFNVYLIKTNSSGNILWTKTFGGDSSSYGIRSIQQTGDSGYIIAGKKYIYATNYSDGYLIKTNSNGDSLWAKTYGGNGYDQFYSVQQTSDGGYIAAGHTNSYGAGNYDVYLVKSDTSGDTLWTKTFGGDTCDYAYSVQQTSDGGYIITGETSSYGAGCADFYFIKTDENGNIGIEENKELRVESTGLRVEKNKIYLEIADARDVELKLYDVCGRMREVLYAGSLSGGSYIFSPKIRASGVYFVSLEFHKNDGGPPKNYRKIQKLILIK